MIKTHEQFLDFFGLRRGDIIEIDNHIKFKIEQDCYDAVSERFYLENQNEYEDYKNLSFLIGKEYEIVKKAKYVGEKICNRECENCPLKAFGHFCREYPEDNDLYAQLDLLKMEYDFTDEEIYNVLKDRLDKEVNE